MLHAARQLPSWLIYDVRQRMKTINGIAYASSAACFAIVIQIGPESTFWENHSQAALLLGAGISTGVLGAFLRETRLFEKPGTIGNRVFFALGILVSLAGIGAYIHAFKGIVATGFFGGAALLAILVVHCAIRPKLDALEARVSDTATNDKTA